MSYVSIVTSIGAMIIGFMLVQQQHEGFQRNLLVSRSMTSIGEETLAALCCLPYTLLMYGRALQPEARHESLTIKYSDLGSMIAFPSRLLSYA